MLPDKGLQVITNFLIRAAGNFLVCARSMAFFIHKGNHVISVYQVHMYFVIEYMYYILNLI